jgi:hypothetical protein
MSTFTSILNRDCEGFMALELGYSFLDSFHDSFPESSQSSNFPSGLLSKLEPPTYSNVLRLLDKVVECGEYLHNIAR